MHKERWDVGDLANMTPTALAGAADMVELLARAFSYPDGTVAAALSDGRFIEDAKDCAAEAGLSAAVAEAIDRLDVYRGADAGVLNEKMRKGFSILYLAPGDRVPVFPYEGPFRFVASGRSGEPMLFRNRSAEDVVRQMRAVGSESDPTRHEPADAIWFELAFLARLYGLVLSTVEEGDEVARECSVVRWDEFVEGHCRPWMVDFMARTRRKAPDCSFGEVHGDLAALGEAVLSELLFDGYLDTNRSA